MKGPIANSGHIVVDIHLYQGAAVREGPLSNARHRVGHHNFHQSLAVEKGKILNACGFGWDPHIQIPIHFLTSPAGHFNKRSDQTSEISSPSSIFQTSFARSHISRVKWQQSQANTNFWGLLENILKHPLTSSTTNSGPYRSGTLLCHQKFPRFVKDPMLKRPKKRALTERGQVAAASKGMRSNTVCRTKNSHLRQ